MTDQDKTHQCRTAQRGSGDAGAVPGGPQPLAASADLPVAFEAAEAAAVTAPQEAAARAVAEDFFLTYGHLHPAVQLIPYREAKIGVADGVRHVMQKHVDAAAEELRPLLEQVVGLMVKNAVLTFRIRLAELERRAAPGGTA